MLKRPPLAPWSWTGALASFAWIASLAAAPACTDAKSSSSTSSTSSSSSSSSGSGGTDGAVTGVDANVPRDVCEGDCKVNTVVLVQDGGSRAFERAQFGTELRDGGGTGFHVELYAGGSTDCPTQNSPTPKRTFVVAAIPAMTPGSTASDSEGVRGAFLDFESPSAPPLEKASKTVVTLVALDPSPQPQWLAMDIESTLPSGTVKGHLYATFCQSLSLP